MKRLITFLFLLTLVVTGRAQLLINEFMASNSSSFSDDAGEYDDWIEIYNNSDQSLSLEGYYLTDNFTSPDKFEFPGSLSIPAHGFLIIFADEDGSQGDLHANFKLDKENEQIAITRILPGDTLFVDSLSYHEQLTDISCGRFPDGEATLEYFSHPTPGEANISDYVEGIAPAPDFSIPGGFFSNPQTLELSSGLPGAEIRYTLDGSIPTEDDYLYTAPITLDSTSVVKAIVFADNYWPGPILTHTYFIDELFVALDPSDRMYIISVSTEPDLLWDETAGLLHDRNEFNTWEYKANVELFDPDGNQVINQNAGIRLFGNSTRRMDQKSIALVARNEYGSNRFAYPLFHDRPFEEYKSFVLRNTGNDWSSTYMRDALCQELVRNNMDIDAQSNTQTVLYLNGQFYGISDMKEKINEHYLEAHYNIDPDELTMLVDYGQSVIGETDEYLKFNGFVANNDFSDERLYSQLQSQMQLTEYRNLYIAQIYFANIDMFLNQKYWKEPRNQSRWRWILYDTEISFGQGDYYTYTNDYGTLPWDNSFNFATTGGNAANWPFLRPWSTEKIVSLLENPDFRNDYIQTFAVHLNTTFKPSRVKQVIDSLAHKLRLEMPDQIKAYGGHTVDFNPYGTHFGTMEEWEGHLDTLYLFAEQRPEYLRTFIQDRFSVEGTYELVPTMENDACGKILIQELDVPLDSAGIYFDSVPLRVKVVPNPGYRFIKWKGVEIPDSLSPSVSLMLTENTVLQAIFEPEEDILITEIFYNPASDPALAFVEVFNPKHSTDIDLGGYSFDGDIQFTFPTGSLLKPGSYLVIAANPTRFSPGIEVWQWSSGSLSDTAGTILLKDDLGSLVDSVHYKNSPPWPGTSGDYSIELKDFFLDNNDGSNWQTGIFTQGSAGAPLPDQHISNLIINEFLSFNENAVFDEFNEFNDWIELLNTGTEPVNIGGLFITNNLDTPAMYQIPNTDPLTTNLQPGEYKLLWADRKPEQGALHLGFNLNKGGCEVGISADGRTFIDNSDSVSMLNADLSFGRYPDASGSWQYFDAPTPAKLNSLPPVFLYEPQRFVEKKTDYLYEIEVSDPDDDNLIIGVYVRPNWLYYLSNENPPVLSGRSPTGSFNPVSVGIFVTDGYSKPVDQLWQITQLKPDRFESLTQGEAEVYPNPTDGMVHVIAKTEDDFVKLSIYSMAGEMLWQSVASAHSGYIDEELDLTGFEKGLYFLTIQLEDQLITRKIIHL
ncbi:MAG: lamin tail domain-containing protein [Bacteroidales bacterium]|nr:lamin tail domain-containing protein [Bacteroidales bacterium]